MVRVDEKLENLYEIILNDNKSKVVNNNVIKYNNNDFIESITILNNKINDNSIKIHDNKLYLRSVNSMSSHNE